LATAIAHPAARDESSARQAIAQTERKRLDSLFTALKNAVVRLKKNSFAASSAQLPQL